MGRVAMVLVSLLVTGCGVTSNLSDQEWSAWESEDEMLPNGFPFPVKDEIRQEGKNRFWTIDYDINGDAEPDVRVWYYLQQTETIASLDRKKMMVARNPYKVERLKMGFFAVFSKVDFELKGQAQEVQKHVNGVTVTEWVK